MQEIYVENIKEILRTKSRIQKELKVKLTNKGHNIFIDGKPEDEFLALKVLEAVNLGFSVDSALQLKEEDIILQSLNIKDLTKRNDLDRVRARIIGTNGRTLKTLDNLTNCDLSLHDNQIGIIGDTEEIEDAIQALTSIIQGSKQSNVYARLEKQRKKKRLEDKNINLIGKK
jgi:ribosomal RNA assembly protein